MPAFTHTDGHHLSVDGARLYHEAIGPADGPALLMLHGGLGSMTDLNPIAERLAGRWRLIGIDLRGHGRSTLGNTPLTYARHEADVRAVLDALGITRCAMFGFSDGGVVAYRLAASMPERATHLATLGAQWRLNEDDPAIDMLRGMTPDLWRDIDAEAVADDQRLNPEPDVDRLVATAVACWTDLGSSGYPFGRRAPHHRAHPDRARRPRRTVLARRSRGPAQRAAQRRFAQHPLGRSRRPPQRTGCADRGPRPLSGLHATLIRTTTRPAVKPFIG